MQHSSSVIEEAWYRPWWQGSWGQHLEPIWGRQAYQWYATRRLKVFLAQSKLMATDRIPIWAIPNVLPWSQIFDIRGFFFIYIKITGIGNGNDRYNINATQQWMYLMRFPFWCYQSCLKCTCFTDNGNDLCNNSITPLSILIPMRFKDHTIKIPQQ